MREVVEIFLSSPTALTSLFAAAALAISSFWSAISQRKAKEELSKANEEIHALNQKIFGSLTGGDGYAYLSLTLARKGNGADTFYPVVIQSGEYPIYDVQIDIVDLQSMPVGSMTIQQIATARCQIELRNMTVGYASMVPNVPITLNCSTGGEYNVFFVARNGGWHQRLRQIFVNGNWEFSTVVLRDNNEIFRQSSSNFPLPIPF